MTNMNNDPSAIEDVALRVLRAERDAIGGLLKNLPPDFVSAVTCILQCNGRVIISGVGKSGHIGRKIAATLASTGTPSYFVHATEASHGDLGMITSNDVCLLISNSGETVELRDLLYHTQRFNIPLIAISSRPDSTLMVAANHKLCLPKWPEACSIGLAPTTSTTLTLALGDALAVALMESRSFKSEDFGVLHPGGKLGARMRKVSDLMHSGDNIPCLDKSASIEDVILTMTSAGFGIAALTENGRVFGVITDGDLRRNMTDLMVCCPADIANRSPVTIHPNTLAAEGLALLHERGVTALLVVDDDRYPIGVLNIHDFLRAGMA